MNETHAPSAWGRSQVFAQSSATKWDVHKEGKDSVAKPGVKREAARAPVFHQTLVKPWNPNGAYLMDPKDRERAI